MLNYVEIHRSEDKKLHDNKLNNSALAAQINAATKHVAINPTLGAATKAAINNSAISSISPVTLNVKEMMKAGDAMKNISGITASATKALHGKLQ